MEVLTLKQWAIMTCTIYGAFCIFSAVYVSVAGQLLCWGTINKAPFVYLSERDAHQCVTGFAAE